jgi:Protein of unknown function (DUF1800)
MGNEIQNRKDFLKSLTGLKSKPTEIELNELDGGNETDPLFEKYSRKTLGQRQYSKQMVMPNADGSIALRVGTVTSGLAPYTGQWTIWEVVHLIKRVNFGVKKETIDALLAMPMSAAVDSVLSIAAPTNPSTAPLNNYQTNIADSTGVALGYTWVNNRVQYLNGSDDGLVDYYRGRSIEQWNWGVIVNESNTISIREKMVQFWYHFLPINFEGIRNVDGNASFISHEYMQLFRNNPMGNFKTLMKAVSKSAAMLVYLGGQYSTATTPNENFARELLELFTMGKAPTQNYTEADIIAASKIFSGWICYGLYGGSTYGTTFVPSLHNQSNKVFSSFFGNTTIANQPGAGGANEFDLFFDMLFTHQGTTIAKYICRRLYRFFVYYDIDANVEANVISPMAVLLESSNWNIGLVVSKLLKSEHFFDNVNRGVMIKSPIDFVAGMIKTLKINTTVPASVGPSQLQKQYEVWQTFHNYTFYNFEQGIGAVPTVAGWKAYYQSPTFYQNWINSNTVQQRYLFIDYIINGYITPSVGNIYLTFDRIAFVQQFSLAIAQNPVSLVDAIIPYLFTEDLPFDYKVSIKKQTLLTNQTDNYYWTNAWNAFVANPTNITYRNIVDERLKALFTGLLQLSEFQLM